MAETNVNTSINHYFNDMREMVHDPPPLADSICVYLFD